MKIRTINLIIVILAFTFFKSSIDENKLNLDRLNSSTFDDSFESSRMLMCPNNCFFPASFSHEEPMDFESTLGEGNVMISWNYGFEHVAMFSAACQRTVVVEFRSILGVTVWQQSIYSLFTENFDLDITNDFTASNTGSKLIDITSLSNITGLNVYEYRIVVNGSCDSGISCCYESDWSVFMTIMIP